MKFYDPYYLIDPTKPHDPVAETGRAADGRFTAKLETNTMSDDNFPIDSRFWSRYAKGVIGKVISLRNREFADRVLPDDNIVNFSWRMICEMYEAARDALLAGMSNEDAIAAAHKYLMDKQYDATRTQLDRLMDDVKEMNAIDMSEAINKWMSENWDAIPEVEL